jgi:hypothetical protein
MEAEIERQFQVRLAELRSQGKTIYDQQIDPDDTSTGRPELWCIVKTDTDELVQDHMRDGDVEKFLSEHPDWVHIWEVRDDIQNRVRETWGD